MRHIRGLMGGRKLSARLIRKAKVAVVKYVKSAALVSPERFRVSAYISGIVRMRRPCGLTGHTFRPRSSVVSISNIGVNNRRLKLVTKPYSMRSCRRILRVTRGTGASKTGLLHNNTFGPEADPCTFRKLKLRKLSVLYTIERRIKLPVIARLVSSGCLSMFGRGISLVRVNTHGVRGFSLLGRLKRISHPVLLGEKLGTACRR